MQRNDKPVLPYCGEFGGRRTRSDDVLVVFFLFVFYGGCFLWFLHYVNQSNFSRQNFLVSKFRSQIDLVVKIHNACELETLKGDLNKLEKKMKSLICHFVLKLGTLLIVILRYNKTLCAHCFLGTKSKPYEQFSKKNKTFTDELVKCWHLLIFIFF